jgi:hypothetical protein
MKKQRWIAVDFDGTLATFGCNWPEDYRATGDPIPAMVNRVKQWIADGEDVRIFTARLDCYHPKFTWLTPNDVKEPIEFWCFRHLGKVLPITNVKDYFCKALYDDRAVQVEQDTGRLIV